MPKKKPSTKHSSKHGGHASNQFLKNRSARAWTIGGIVVVAVIALVFFGLQGSNANDFQFSTYQGGRGPWWARSKLLGAFSIEQTP